MVAASAAVAETAVLAMKSRRFRGGVMTAVSLVPMCGSTHPIVQSERIAQGGFRSSAETTLRGDVTADSNLFPTLLP